MTKKNETLNDLLRRAAGFPAKGSSCCGPAPATDESRGETADEPDGEAPANTTSDGCCGDRTNGAKRASGRTVSRRWLPMLPVDQPWGDGRSGDRLHASKTACACLSPAEAGEC